jgi:hypothetical protein
MTQQKLENCFRLNKNRLFAFKLTITARLCGYRNVLFIKDNDDSISTSLNNLLAATLPIPRFKGIQPHQMYPRGGCRHLNFSAKKMGSMILCAEGISRKTV